MNMVLKNARVYRHGKLQRLDIEVRGGIVSSIQPSVSPVGGAVVFDFHNSIIVPGFADVHVHLREPGFSYKETVATGTAAAAAGGYTAVCAMPNLAPPPDSPENLAVQAGIIKQDALIPVFPYACITRGQLGRGELVDFSALVPMAFGFSDDGRGVQSGPLMLSAMEKVKAAGSFISAHCEDEELLGGGYIHSGEYAAAHGHKGICSQSEWGQLARDIQLVGQTGCPYHVCHVSTKESVEIIRRAKADGLPVTCETAPHYLLLCDMDIEEDGRFKMNPPLRSAQDRDALVAALKDGTIDMIATDHAPHSREEKAKGLAGSAMGIVGLETAFPVLYTGLVKTGKLPLETLIDRMALAPRRRFPALPGGEIEVGAPFDGCVIDLEENRNIDPANFCSKGRSTPFEGMRVWGKILMTCAGGNIVWQNK